MKEIKDEIKNKNYIKLSNLDLSDIDIQYLVNKYLIDSKYYNIEKIILTHNPNLTENTCDTLMKLLEYSINLNEIIIDKYNNNISSSKQSELKKKLEKNVSYIMKFFFFFLIHIFFFSYSYF